MVSIALLAMLVMLPWTSLAACPTCGPVFPPPSGLEVHEWGTFTTLNASSGAELEGLYVDATRLPAFVHGLPYFNYNAAKGWAPMDRLKNVTVKMETPVLYFYSAKEMDVDVKVRFQGGTISQWYPACYDCETNPTAPSVDFAKEPYPGHIGWKAKVLAPTSNLPYTSTALGGETLEWTAPRSTTANQLRGEKGEIEKFLFYRGLGHFPATLGLDFLPDGTFRVVNKGPEDIVHVMVYDRPAGNESEIATVWYSGPMKAGQVLKLKRDNASTEYGSASGPMEAFHGEMVKAGLTTQEARALLNTWYTGYFIEGGLKVFWILPRAQVDKLLPLEIKPAPDKIERVIVGRSEILTPEFEAKLRHAKKTDSLEILYKKDKYYLAYLDFLRQDGIALSLGSESAPARASWTRPGQAGWATPWFSKGNRSTTEVAADLRTDIIGRSIRPVYHSER
ncbi:MAG: hypothetical protein M3Y08_02210 [Fibrobacterota bacterium]|nr:hypothetical protein [Fibrobacterota bacterium]